MNRKTKKALPITAGQKGDIEALAKRLGQTTIVKPKTRYEADRLIRMMKKKKSFNEHHGGWTK